MRVLSAPWNFALLPVRYQPWMAVKPLWTLPSPLVVPTPVTHVPAWKPLSVKEDSTRTASNART